MTFPGHKKWGKMSQDSARTVAGSSGKLALWTGAVHKFKCTASTKRPRFLPQGTLHWRTQIANACQKDYVTPGRLKWGTSHIHSGGRENSKDFLKRRLLKGSLILSYDLETKKAGKALWEEGSTWTKSRDTDWGKGWKLTGVQQALWLSTFPSPLPPKRKPKTIPCVRDDGNIYKHISKGLHRFGWMPTPFPYICRQTKHSKTLTGKSQTPVVGHVPLGVGREINDPLFTTAGLPS